MTSNLHTDKYVMKSTGEVREKKYLRYICYHRSRKLCECDGQSVYSAAKVDNAVIEVMAALFSNISDAPDEAEHSAVNRVVARSSRAGGAKTRLLLQALFL